MKSDTGITIDRVLSIVPTGRENAVSMRYLARVFGVKERIIRQAILDARLSGYIVCGTSYGYYYPANKGELVEYVHSAKSRAITSLRSLKAARALLKLSEAELPR